MRDQVTLTFDINDGAGNSSVYTKTYNLGTPVATLTQNFDGVVSPTLPAGWTNTIISGTLTNWFTSPASSTSSPNLVFAINATTASGAQLTMPSTLVNTASGKIKFRIKYATESNFDGAVLDIKIGSGPFQAFRRRRRHVRLGRLLRRSQRHRQPAERKAGVDGHFGYLHRR